MVSDLPQLERASRQPLVEQIVRHYRSAIQHGRLRPGDRMPTIRDVAQRLKVTRNTVQEAYRRLALTGLVASTVGRGTQVTGTPDDGPQSLLSPAAQAVRRQSETAPQVPAMPPGTEVQANFAELLPDTDQFPVDAFRSSLERVMRARGGDLLNYGHPAGDPELRALLASRREGADTPCTPEEILITSGAQQGIDLVLRTFAAPGDAVAVPVPSYHVLFGLLAAHGLELVPIPTDASGMDLAELERVLARPGVRLLYLMPTFHNPTGRTLDLAQREELMRVVQKTRVPVLEDEFQRELRVEGEPLPFLRDLDRRKLTITQRTFSKGLFPGARTGWVQASPQILSSMVALKRVADLETSPLLQAALVDFLRSGALDDHLEQVSGELRERHRAMQSALAECMPEGVRWSRPEGGFALWLEGPPGMDGDRVADLAARRGVMVTPGRVFDPQAQPSPCLRLSLSRVTPPQIRAGIEILAGVVNEQIARANPLQRTNFL